MRHRKNFNHLSRPKGHRKAMLTNLAKSLIIHKRIMTTIAKAKALRKFVEPIITMTKQDVTHRRRLIFSYFQDKSIVKELFNEIADKVVNRPGGYTRIIKMGTRLGDNAELCMMELVDYNSLLGKEGKISKSSTRRGKKKRIKEGTTAEILASEAETALVLESKGSVESKENIGGDVKLE